MKKFRVPTQEEAGVLLAMAAVMFGGWVRLFIPAIAGFPINDGGLFTAMIQTLKANGYRLPFYVQYNGLNIPYAYPPLGFYIGAILSDAFHVSAIIIIQWLPAVVLTIAIIAFYFLARAVMGSAFQAGIATLIYAFTPRVITWQIMGGGLTRSLGQLFLLLALTGIYLLFAKGGWKSLILSIVLSALVVLTHPEAAVQTAGFSLLFFLFKGRNKAGIRNAILVAAGTLVLTAAWWVTILMRFGAGPLASASQTGLLTAYAFFYPLLLTFTDEPLATIVVVLALIGFFAQIAKRDFFIPLWLLLPFFVEPRSAPTVATIPLALLAGIAVSEIIFTALSRFESATRQIQFENPLQARSVQLFMLFIGFYLLGSNFYFGTQVAGTTLTSANRAAFDWVVSNTPADSRFLILTGDKELFCDSTQEWFPVLTNRVSLTTLQGREWLDGRRFTNTISNLQNIQGCLASDSPMECLKENIIDSNFNYIYITRVAPLKNYCRAGGTAIRGETLIYDLEQDARYSKAYESKAVVIFMQKP